MIGLLKSTPKLQKNARRKDFPINSTVLLILNSMDLRVTFYFTEFR